MMQQPKPLTFYVGLRYDEDDDQRSGGDYRNVPGAEMRFPLREWRWDIGNVLAYLEQRNVSIPERTDCARCFYQTLGEWWRLWKDHPDLYADAEADESATGHTWRSPGRDTWPAPLSELRVMFEAGHVPKGNPAQRDLFRGMKCRVCTI
jgi:hypothetical protein